MLDGVDAGFGDGGLQVFNAIFPETHELGDGGGRAHGHLLEAEARRQPNHYRGGLRRCHAGVSQQPVPRLAAASASAVMSSPCGPPCENTLMAVHNASRIPSAFSAGHIENSCKSRSGPNFSSPWKASVSPSV